MFTKKISYQNSKWISYFLALETTRKEHSAYTTKTARWYSIALFALALIFVYTGIEVVIFLFIGGFVFLIGFSSKIELISSHIKKSTQSYAKSKSVESYIFQIAAHDIASWIHFRPTSPPMNDAIKYSGLAGTDIDFAHCSESLSGMYQGSIPFCVIYTNVGKYVPYRDSNKRLKHRTENTYRGIFLIIDFECEKNGWVSLNPDQFNNLSWIADYKKMHSKQSFNIAVKNNTLMLALPMSTNPFCFNNNSNLWDEELSKFQNITQSITDLIIQTQKSMISKRERSTG